MTRGNAHALVTGSNSGIGLATALELARNGFRVTGTVRSAAKADVVAEAAADAGVDVATEILDVTDADGCAAVVDAVGPVDVLVNNAGYGITGAVEDVDDVEARAALETMVLAPMRLARLVLPGMRAAGGGRIVNVSSIYGRESTPLTGWYQGAKQALEGLSDALRMEVARDGVHVVLIEPGGFRTNIWDDLARDLERRAGSSYADAYERIGGLMGLSAPLMGEPEACAKVIVRAARSRSPRSRYLVGADAVLTAAAGRATPTVIRDRILRIAQRL